MCGAVATSLGMALTQEAYAAGKLSSLLPYQSGKIIVTSERLGEDSLEILV